FLAPLLQPARRRERGRPDEATPGQRSGCRVASRAACADGASATFAFRVSASSFSGTGPSPAALPGAVRLFHAQTTPRPFLLFALPYGEPRRGGKAGLL